jgi:hypothetical protein
MMLGVPWELGVSGVLEMDARPVGERRDHGVARPGDGAAQDVEARPDVADAAGREGADGGSRLAVRTWRE